MSRQYLAEGVAHSINCFLGSKPQVWPWAPQKPGTAAQACNPSTRGRERSSSAIQQVQGSPGLHEALSREGGMIPGMVLRAFDPIAQESEAGRSLWVWGYLRVHRKLQDGRDHIETLSKKKKREGEEKRGRERSKGKKGKILNQMLKCHMSYERNKAKSITMVLITALDLQFIK